MTVTEAEAWARLRLVQGRSSAALWELVGKRGQAALTVGASAGCNWVVRHGGVAEVHFSLRWDGRALGIADTHGAGNLRVDGTPVGRDWQWLSGQARIDFGQAVMLVETSRGGAIDQDRPVDHAPSPTRSERPGRSSGPPGSEPEPAPRTVTKSTLRAVAGRAAGRTSSPPIVASQPLNASPPPPAAVPGAESLVLTLSNEARRAPRPTLQGMASADSSVPPANGSPSGGARAGAGKPSLNPTLLGVGHADPKQHGVRHAEPTLLGVGRGDQARDGATRQTQPLGAASLADADQRTTRGFPTGAGGSARPVTVAVGGSAPSSHPPEGRRETQRGGGDSGPPGAAVDAVVRGRIRPISDRPPPRDPPQVAEVPSPAPGRSGGAAPSDAPDVPKPPFDAPDVPKPPFDANPVPAAVLFDADAPSPVGVGGFPDGPADLDDLSSPGASRPRRPFPWQYLFVGALTVVAYVAWLYLLEHF